MGRGTVSNKEIDMLKMGGLSPVRWNELLCGFLENGMAKTNEYLEQRCLITEAVLHELGDLLSAHLPAIRPQLQVIGTAWTHAIEKLDATIPDAL